MCTSIAFPDRALYGRNLDLEYHFGEKVVITPRSHGFAFRHLKPLERHYAMIGMASVAEDTPLYAEAVNEKGLYMAGLYFPGNARYFDAPEADRLNVAPWELIPLILGSCSSLREARAKLERVHLLAEPFAPGYPLAALHWQIAAQDGSLIAEPMDDGLHLYEDRPGVLTNNPPYPYQLMNLNNYRGLSTEAGKNSFAPALELTVYGQGMGALGLPGDSSPMSRFVRMTFLKSHAAFDSDRGGQISQFFHLLDAVSMVKGSVVTPEGKLDETIYSCCADAREGIYYYKTYDSCCVHAVRMDTQCLDGRSLAVFPLESGPSFKFTELQGL